MISIDQIETEVIQEVSQLLYGERLFDFFPSKGQDWGKYLTLPDVHLLTKNHKSKVNW